MQLYSLRPRWLLGSGTPPGAEKPFDQHDWKDELARFREKREAKRGGR